MKTSLIALFFVLGFYGAGFAEKMELIEPMKRKNLT